MPDLYIELDAHNVYHLVLHTARRHLLDVYVVTRDYLPPEVNLHLIVGTDDQGGGANWILANIKRCDICVTANSGLAVNCVLRGASVLSPSGEQWGVDAVNAIDHWPSTMPSFTERLDKMIASAKARSVALRAIARPSVLCTSRQPTAGQQRASGRVGLWRRAYEHART
jgi:uncharacterized protein YaiI (UPF0178 family)